MTDTDHFSFSFLPSLQDNYVLEISQPYVLSVATALVCVKLVIWFIVPLICENTIEEGQI